MIIFLLKKYFIPHEHNDHRPHILRWETMAFILGFVFLMEAVFSLQTIILPKSRLLGEILSSVVINETNNRRLAFNDSKLQENFLLNAAAQMKANDMAKKGYFSHDTPEGYSPWYWFDLVGYKYQYAGENLAVNFFDSKDAVDAWMNSSSHRENILNPNFSEIGIGIANGIYDGKEAVFVVQLFGAQSESKPVSKIIPDLPQIGQTKVSLLNNNTPPIKGMVTGSVANQNQILIATTAAGFSAVSVHGGGSNGGKFSEYRNKLKDFFLGAIFSPRQTVSYILSILGIFIFISLILKISIKWTIQHPDLILNGLLVIFIIASALIFNYYVFLAKAQVF